MVLNTREIVWNIIEKKHIHKLYIDAIKDMDNEVIASVRTIREETNTFPIVPFCKFESRYPKFPLFNKYTSRAYFEPISICFIIDDLSRPIQDYFN